MPSPRSIDMMIPAHAPAVAAMVEEAELAGALGMTFPVADLAVRDFVASQLRRRATDSGYLFVVQENGEVVGFCGWIGVERGGERRLVCGIRRASRGRGLGSFAVGMMLEFAFRNLRWPEVQVAVPAAAAQFRSVLLRNGLRPAAAPPSMNSEESPGMETLRLEAEEWRRLRDAPALAALHPALKQVLDAELAAGNEVVETGRGWPDAESVFVRVKHPFRVRSGALPGEVSYLELHDPHWWKAEYHTDSPRHTLAS